jgi:hypothetical protein
MSTPVPFPAGWYDDPERVGNKRWWDGRSWAHPEYDPSGPVGPPAPTRADGIVPVGYILAILMPLIGFILGIVVATRPAKATSKHGAPIIVLSVMAFIVTFVIILAVATHAAHSPVNPGGVVMTCTSGVDPSTGYCNP